MSNAEQIAKLTDRRAELQSHLAYSQAALRAPGVREASQADQVEAEIAWIDAELARLAADP